MLTNCHLQSKPLHFLRKRRKKKNTPETEMKRNQSKSGAFLFEPPYTHVLHQRVRMSVCMCERKRDKERLRERENNRDRKRKRVCHIHLWCQLQSSSTRPYIFVNLHPLASLASIHTPSHRQLARHDVIKIMESRRQFPSSP